MVEYKEGDLLKADVEALVNAVNTVGVMGKGLALQFKLAFPDNFAAYRIAAEKKEVLPGKMFIYSTTLSSNPRFIINFPTKRHWRDRARLNDIKSGLIDLVEVIKNYEIKSIAVPPLGCGLGGLKWNDVRPLIEQSLNDIPDLKVSLYPPQK